jgi:hypothetical protein
MAEVMLINAAMMETMRNFGISTTKAKCELT